MPKIRFTQLPSLFLTPAPAQAEPQVLPLILPDASGLLAPDIAHAGFFALMALVILCLPRRR